MRRFIIDSLKARRRNRRGENFQRVISEGNDL
jgi:hypothetical protein